jgi:hypothetical protein
MIKYLIKNVYKWTYITLNLITGELFCIHQNPLRYPWLNICKKFTHGFSYSRSNRLAFLCIIFEICISVDLLFLVLCFSTSVPQCISVPWASSRCAAKYFLAYFSIFIQFLLHLFLFNTKIGVFRCSLSNIWS